MIEYYFVSYFTLNLLKRKSYLKIEFDESKKQAKIYDLQENYVVINNVKSMDDNVYVVNVYHANGGEYVIHDMSYELQIPFFTEDTYDEISEYLDATMQDEIDITDKAIVKFISNDLKAHNLQLMPNGYSITEINIGELERGRKEAKDKRKNLLKTDAEIDPLIQKLMERHKKKILAIAASKIKD